MAEWKKISEETPPEGKAIKTKIEDADGVRNEQYLIKKGNLWWTADMKMYVYYTPTHWYCHI